MKKILLFPLVAVALFAACTNDGDFSRIIETSSATPDDNAVSFEAYVDRAITRAGLVGELNLDQIQKSQADGGGFGVFAYYTDLQKYNQTFIPNFMYNQGVFFNGSQWEYSPLMYWPNEYGSTAQSADEDKVSFFAYAPFVEESPTFSAMGVVTSGITGFSRNSATGDPLVHYVATFDPANSVDLCWGVNDEDSWSTIQNGSQETAVKGLPWLDVEHPEGTDQRMKFTFKHALSQLNVQIDADVDGGEEVDASTKIWVRSISFTGIATVGSLNLNNVEANKAFWLDDVGITELPCGETVTVYDGRRDGREGASNARVASEQPQGLNPVLVQTEAPLAGVTSTAVNLFGTGADLAAPVYVIPTGDVMTVTIVYDVETSNPRLPGYISDAVTHGLSVENHISKTVSFSTGDDGLENGKKYTLKLHLGMNSVKLDADVTPWDDRDYTFEANVPSSVPYSLTLDKSKVVLAVGDNTSISSSFYPTDVADKSIIWTSADESVAVVNSSGVVTAIGSGETIVSGFNAETGASASIKVLVPRKAVDAIPGFWDDENNPGDIGKIITTDGSLFTKPQADEYGIADADRAAIVAYVGAKGSVDKSPGSEDFHGLAVAMKDFSNSTIAWGGKGATCVSTISYSKGSTVIFDDEYMKGIYYTNYLANADCDPSHTHSAAQSARTFKYSVSVNNGDVPNGCSQWFLPTISQWQYIAQGLTGKTADLQYQVQNDDYKTASINEYISKAGGTLFRGHNYYSCVEARPASAWAINFYYGWHVFIDKGSGVYVRSVLAF